MLSELRSWWRIIKSIIITVGILLSFFAIIEVLHIYNVLRNTYPPLGYAFIFLIVLALVILFTYIVLSINRLPKVLSPPGIVDLSVASLKECNSYCKYLIKYIHRLSTNPNLTDKDCNNIISKISKLQDAIDSDLKPSELVDLISEIERETIEPLLVILDGKAEVEVQNCVRDTMLGVSISPYKSADLFIVVYRNVGMIVRITNIYKSRPPFTEQLLIIRDVLSIVATINYLNYGEQFIEKAFSFIPWIGRSIDDFAQGLGAGLLTSVAGHGTIERCRSYGGFNQEVTKKKLSRSLSIFIKDVKSIFMKDVFERAEGMLRSIAPIDKIRDPLFWQKTKDDISAAIDAVAINADTFVKEPVFTGTQRTIKVGSDAISRSKKTVVQTTSYVQNKIRATSIGIEKGVKYPVKKVSSVIKLRSQKEKEKDPFGELAIKKGFITEDQLNNALKIQADEEISTGIIRPIGRILLNQGDITLQQIGEVLKGDIVIAWNDKGKISCRKCGASSNAKPITEADFEDDEIVICNECGKKINSITSPGSFR